LKRQVIEAKSVGADQVIATDEDTAIANLPSRDAAFIEGFSGSITLERTQTIMQGAAFCDFRFRAGNPRR
jgi:hypothetical protein